jgi:hypothetical protein
METQICTKCNIEQSITEFRKDQHNPTGYHVHCRTCFNLFQKEYRTKNRDVVNRYATNYYKENAERIKAMRKLRRQGKPTTEFHSKNKIFDENSYYNRGGWKKRRENSWRQRGMVGMTYDLYEQMLIDQNNKCAICNLEHTDIKKLHVDHCHNTGKVRGLLCSNCNNGMGKLGDSIERLELVINYLKQEL